MSTADLNQMLMGLGALSALLLVGTFLRAKVKFFQKLLLPASVIGGFIGLLLGPIILKDYAILRFPENWLTTWASLPGVLIVPIFAAVPLGMFMGKKTKGGFKKAGPKALISLGLFAICGCVQQVIAFGTNMAYSAAVPGSNLYRTFGYELAQGFTGGHGTAAAVGPLLESYGLEYWATAQGVAITCATVGLVGGMLLGILFINIAQRKGKTALLGKSGSIPAEISTGINKNVDKQASLGRETTTSSSIETITLHLGLLLLACLMAFGLKEGLFPLLGAPGMVLSYIPVWFDALLCMYVINAVLIKCKLHWMVDTKVKSRITGTLTDFAVIAAIASLDVAAVAVYAVPLVIMCVLGFLATYFITFPMYKACFKDDHPFERGIMSWGVNTGVMITGMMLLKICDPDYETPVLADFSLGFSMSSFFTIILTPAMYALVATGTTMQLFLFFLVQGVVWLGIALLGTGLLRRAIKGEVKQDTGGAPPDAA